MKPYPDWKILLQEALAGGYTLELNNSGNSMIAGFIADNTRDRRAGINTAPEYYAALESWIRQNMKE